MAETQFDRERMLLGDEAMQVLAASHVAVFGVGGVGSFAAEALARAGGLSARPSQPRRMHAQPG